MHVGADIFTVCNGIIGMSGWTFRFVYVLQVVADIFFVFLLHACRGRRFRVLYLYYVRVGISNCITRMLGPTCLGFVSVFNACRGSHVQRLLRFYMHVGAHVCSFFICIACMSGAKFVGLHRYAFMSGLTFQGLHVYYMHAGDDIFRVCVGIRCMSGRHLQVLHLYYMYVGAEVFGIWTGIACMSGPTFSRFCIGITSMSGPIFQGFYR